MSLFSEEYRHKLSESCKGRVPWNKGVPRPTETRMKISKTRKDRKIKVWNKGIPRTEETKQKISAKNKGLKHTDEYRKKMSNRLRGNSNPSKREDVKKKLSEANKGQVPWILGKHHSDETRKKMSERAKGRVFSDEHRNNIRIARMRQVMPTSKTSIEVKFEEICKKYNLPFIYVGDGSFWIEDLNPDFIDCNGKKVVIDIFGDYWHSPLLNPRIKSNRTFYGREEVLKKYGWKLIVLWESDLIRVDAEKYITTLLHKNSYDIQEVSI